MSIQPQTPTERKPVHISTLFQQNKLFKWNTKKTPTLLVGKALSHTLSSLDPTLTSNTQPSTLPLTKSSDSIAIRVAAFDIDGTLIHTKTNSPFPKSGSDWRWKYECIPDHLTQLSNNGYQVCFFSNQKGMSLGKGKRKQWFMQKMETIGTLLKGGFEVYAAIENDLYRKPSTTSIEPLI